MIMIIKKKKSHEIYICSLQTYLKVYKFDLTAKNSPLLFKKSKPLEDFFKQPAA